MIEFNISSTALLRLGVKRLSGFHLFDQLVGRLKRRRVYQLLNHPFQKPNPPIDFQAFVTHAAIAFAPGPPNKAALLTFLFDEGRQPIKLVC